MRAHRETQPPNTESENFKRSWAIQQPQKLTKK